NWPADRHPPSAGAGGNAGRAPAARQAVPPPALARTVTLVHQAATTPHQPGRRGGPRWLGGISVWEHGRTSSTYPCTSSTVRAGHVSVTAMNFGRCPGFL